MKTKTFLTILALLIGAQITSAQHIIYGGPVEGVWSFDKSPYVIKGSIYVDEFNSLIIEPGVDVIFETTDPFIINGSIIAEGTISDTILFTTNLPERGWGGIRIETLGSLRESSILSFCKFEHANAKGYNRNLSGGAIGIENTYNLTIQNCLFEHNRALVLNIENPLNSGSGGAIAIWSSSIRLTKNVFRYNESVNGGALFIDEISNATIDNSLFYGNTAEFNGGAVAISNHSTPTFVNCTFVDNYANQKGGAIALSFDANASFVNSILWENTAFVDGDQVDVMNKSVISLLYTNIEGGLKSISGYNLDDGNQVFYDVDPQFLTHKIFPYSFPSTSPCVDGGTINSDYFPVNFDQPATDLHGNPRVKRLSVDLGYFECELFPQDFNRDINLPDDPIVVYSDWEIIPHTGTQKDFIDIHFVDDNNGWIVAEMGTVIFTHDRGLSWEERFFGNSVDFTVVHFIDANTGFVAGTVDIGPQTKGICYKTNDGGENWEMVYLSETSMIVTSIAFSDDQRGYITGHTLSPYGQDGIIVETEDGGANWELAPPNPVSVSFDKMMFIDENMGWMTGRMDVGPNEVSVIYKSVDGGENWNVVYYDYNETGMQSVDFFGRDYGMATGYDGSIYTTYNSGHTWELKRMRQYGFNDLVIGSDGQAWLVGDDGVTLKSSDYGKNWEKIITLLNTDLNSICRTPGDFLWVAGDNGTLYFQAPKSIDEGDDGKEENGSEQRSLTSSANLGKHQNQSGHLVEHKNYPNPFTGQTTISFELDQPVYVQLRVHSLNGQLIETLLDQTVEAGEHNVRFAAEDLPAGIYSYSLKAGTAIENGKMIITN